MLQRTIEKPQEQGPSAGCSAWLQETDMEEKIEAARMEKLRQVDLLQSFIEQVILQLFTTLRAP